LGNNLVWKKDKQLYWEMFYMIFNIVRYKRYPNPKSSIERLFKQVDNYYSNKEYLMTRAVLDQLGPAINEDALITDNEKNLWRSRREFRLRRTRAALAKREGKKSREYGEWVKALKALVSIQGYFTDILYPYEVKNLHYQGSRIIERVKELGRELGKSGKTLAALAATFARDKKKVLAKQARERAATKKALALNQTELMKLLRIVRSEARSYRIQPVYKKWWFWTLLGTVAAGATVGIIAATKTKETLPLHSGMQLPPIGGTP